MTQQRRIFIFAAALLAFAILLLTVFKDAVDGFLQEPFAVVIVIETLAVIGCTAAFFRAPGPDRRSDYVKERAAKRDRASYLIFQFSALVIVLMGFASSEILTVTGGEVVTGKVESCARDSSNLTHDLSSDVWGSFLGIRADGSAIKFRDRLPLCEQKIGTEMRAYLSNDGRVAVLDRFFNKYGAVTAALLALILFFELTFHSRRSTPSVSV